MWSWAQPMSPTCFQNFVPCRQKKISASTGQCLALPCWRSMAENTSISPSLHDGLVFDLMLQSFICLALAETESNRERALVWSARFPCGCCLFNGLTNRSVCCARHSALSPSPLQASPFPAGGGNDPFLDWVSCPRADLKYLLFSPWRDVPAALPSASLHACRLSCSAEPVSKSCLDLELLGD